VFYGDLDITTLGGAGFASQRTVDTKSWDLASYDGLQIKLGKSDGKKYTLILKDEVLPKRPDGREQSTVSWEYDFTCQKTDLFIPWGDFKPTYRGKPKSDAKSLDLEDIKRISIMMRRLVRLHFPTHPCTLRFTKLQQLLRRPGRSVSAGD
jgi:hypothetical protein